MATSRLNDHDVTAFVHVWKNVGRKVPAPAQLNRSFSAPVAEALSHATSMVGFSEIYRRLPNAFAWFSVPNEIEDEELKALYKTPFVEIEDETNAPALGNPAKMYYKNARAFDLVRKTGEEFDLVIRLRPDMEVTAASRPDWHDIRESCNTKRQVFLEFGSAAHAAMGYVVGDVFGVGSYEAMEAYSSAGS